MSNLSRFFDSDVTISSIKSAAQKKKKKKNDVEQIQAKLKTAQTKLEKTANDPAKRNAELLKSKLKLAAAKQQNLPIARSASSALAGSMNKQRSIADAKLNVSRAQQGLNKALLPSAITEVRSTPAYNKLLSASQNKGTNFGRNLNAGNDTIFGGTLTKYATDDQLATYQALRQKDKGLADTYLNQISQEAANKKAQDIVAKTNTNNALATTGLGYVSGLQRFQDSIAIGGGGRAEQGAEVLAGNDVGSNLTGAQKVAFDVGNAVGYMSLPIAGSAILGMVGSDIVMAQAATNALRGVDLLKARNAVNGISSAVGAGSMGASVYRADYKDAVAAGESATDARTFALLDSAKESVLQYLMGGINRLGGVGVKAVGNAVAKSKLGTEALAKINGAVDKLAKTPKLKAVVNGLETAGVLASKSGAEAMEEWTQAVLDPVIRNVAFDEHNKVKPFSEEAMYSAMLGALTAGVMNSASVPSTYGSINSRNNNRIAERELEEARIAEEEAQREQAAARAERLANSRPDYIADSAGGVTPNNAGLLPAPETQTTDYDAFVKRLRDKMYTQYRGDLQTPREAEQPATVSTTRDAREIMADLEKLEQRHREDLAEVDRLFDEVSKNPEYIGYYTRSPEEKRLREDYAAMFDESYEAEKAKLEAELAAAFGEYADTQNAEMSAADRLRNRAEKLRNQRFAERQNAQTLPTLASVLERVQNERLQQQEEAFMGRYNSDSEETARRIKAFRSGVPLDEMSAEQPTAESTVAQPAAETFGFPNTKPSGIENAFQVPEGEGREVESRFGTNSIQKAVDLPNEVKEFFVDATHNRVPVEQSAKEAQAVINKYGSEAVRQHIDDKVKRGQALNSTEMMASVQLIRYYGRENNTEAALQFGLTMHEAASDTARALNAIKEMQKALPGGFITVAKAINKKLINSGDQTTELTQAQLDDIGLMEELTRTHDVEKLNLDKATPEMRKWLGKLQKYQEKAAQNNEELDIESYAAAKMMEIAYADVKTDARSKFRALQRLSMLTNFKTHMRNIVGNAANAAVDMEIMSSAVSTLYDKILSKSTGVRTTKINPELRARAKALKKAFDAAKRDYALGFRTGSKYDEKLSPATGSFRNKGLGKLGNEADRLFNGFLLSLEDMAFSVPQYEATLTQIMKANPELVEQNGGEPTVEMINAATESALRSTYQDTNIASEKISAVRDLMGVMGDAIAPFVRTPVNVAIRGLELSPLGFIEGFYKGAQAKKLANGETLKRSKLFYSKSEKKLGIAGETIDTDIMTLQRQAAELIGRGVVGSGLMILGILLKATGAGSGDEADEIAKEQGWSKVTGKTANSVKIGNYWYDISSLPPVSVPILAGMAATKKISWGSYLEALSAMGNTILDMPVLSGIKDALGGGYNGKGAAEIAAKMLTDIVTEAIPFTALSRQIATFADPYKRTTATTAENGAIKNFKYGATSILNTIPKLREKLPAQVDSFGREIESVAGDTTVARFFNAFINPVNVSKDKTDAMTAEIERLASTLENPAQALPNAGESNVSDANKVKHKLNAQEKSDYLKTQGTETRDILEDLFKSSTYKDASDAEKLDLVKEAYAISGYKAREEYASKNRIDYNTDTAYNKYKAYRSAKLSYTAALMGTGVKSGSVKNHDKGLYQQRYIELAKEGLAAAAYDGLQYYSNMEHKDKDKVRAYLDNKYGRDTAYKIMGVMYKNH